MAMKKELENALAKDMARQMQKKMEEYQHRTIDKMIGVADPLPPEVQKKLDDLAAEAKRIREEYRAASEELARQQALIKHGIRVGSTLYGEDGETAEVVWVQSMEQGGGIVVNVTQTKTIPPTHLDDGYWATKERHEGRIAPVPIPNGGTGPFFTRGSLSTTLQEGLKDIFKDETSKRWHP